MYYDGEREREREREELLREKEIERDPLSTFYR